MDTPELSLLQARKEIGDMAALARSMFSRIRGDFEADPMDFATEIDWFTAKENYADTMYEELSKFLLAVSNSDLSDKTRMRVGIKLRIVSELENITDECLSLALLLKKKSSKGLVFESESFLGLKPLSDHVEEFLAFVADRLHRGITEIELSMASEMENEIDEDKRRLKKLARQRLKEGADVRAELLYIDFVRHMEKIGDYAYAIAGELRNFPSR
jgi:phosphate:Na+ symporter